MKNILLIGLLFFATLTMGQSYGTLPFSDNFSGTGTALSSYWSTSYEDGNAVIDRRNLVGPWPKFTFGPSNRGSAYNSTTDPSDNGMAIYRTANASSAKYQSAILGLDLYNKAGISINFNIVDWGSGYALDSLKIYISNNGGATYGSSFKLVNLSQPPYNDGFWNTVSVDISSLAESNSMVLSSTSKIKFTFNLKGIGDVTSPKIWTSNQFIYLDNFTVTTTGALPVELLLFEGNERRDYNEIHWATASEINNDFFVLESSSNGVDYYPIYLVNGAGNSSSIINYSFNDFNFHEVTYYRLKQVDYDGTTEYSKTITLFQKINYIEIYGGKSITIIGKNFNKLMVYDLNGKFIYEIPLNNALSIQNIELKETISDEFYIIQVHGNQSYISKLIKTNF